MMKKSLMKMTMTPAHDAVDQYIHSLIGTITSATIVGGDRKKKGNMTELKQLEYNDGLVNFASLLQQHGVKRVLMDFQMHYPGYFMEIKNAINSYPNKPAAALLRK